MDEDHAELSGVATSGSRRRRDDGNRSVSGPRMVRTYAPVCRGGLAQAQRDGGVLCAQAAHVCASTPNPHDHGYWIYTAPAGPTGHGPADATGWSTNGQITCFGPRASARARRAVEPIFTVEDFRRLPLPAARLGVQPADGYTLVNIPTNLYADARARVFPTRVLGYPVRVKAIPERFRWTYGDGSGLTTVQAGGPYPQLDTAHTYLAPGSPTVRLATVYRGSYSVDGGPWQPVVGTATVASRPVTLTVEEAVSSLVTDVLEPW